MANLVKPDKDKHKFVVGIDFGHGETSAAIHEIEWGVNLEKSRYQVNDIRIEPGADRENIIVSAIRLDHDGSYSLGSKSFYNHSSQDHIRIGFKAPPRDINGEQEKLMTKFMECVYRRILKMETRLTKDNHLVYIARPSGWTDEKEKEIYREMALNAGLPLAGLMSESRAAIYYAKCSPQADFKRNINDGAIVFDLGSSTLDMTYYSQNSTPIDYGCNCGASSVDTRIYEKFFMSNDRIKSFIENYPQYQGSLLFHARKIKETIFKEKMPEIDIDWKLKELGIPKDDSQINNYIDIKINVKYDSYFDFIEDINNNCNFTSKINEAILDFRCNRIDNKKINGIYLTGGASKMDFVKDSVSKSFNVDESLVKIDPCDPSLTISRGISLLGAAKAINDVLISEFEGLKPKPQELGNLVIRIKENVIVLYVDFIIKNFVGNDEYKNVNLNKVIDMTFDDFVNSKDVEKIICETIRDYNGFIHKRIKDLIERNDLSIELIEKSDNILFEENKKRCVLQSIRIGLQSDIMTILLSVISLFSSKVARRIIKIAKHIMVNRIKKTVDLNNDKVYVIISDYYNNIIDEIQNKTIITIE